ncbi:hypothetical protein [Micromonospora fluostatini]|uniref:hypothetical protein n=1 Tax=Micromonospora sp. JCM 30529 TaxID=3421643 RepID=UPI003D183953
MVYTDGTRQAFTLAAPDWYGGPHVGGTAAVVTAYQNRPGNQRVTVPACVYYAGVRLQDKPVTRVELPAISARPAVGVPTMHIFAVAVGG